MPQLTINMSAEEIKLLVLQLPVEELLTLATAIEEQVRIDIVTDLAETCFKEWNEQDSCPGFYDEAWRS